MVVFWVALLGGTGGGMFFLQLLSAPLAFYSVGCSVLTPALLCCSRPQLPAYSYSERALGAQRRALEPAWQKGGGGCSLPSSHQGQWGEGGRLSQNPQLKGDQL